VRLFQIHQDFVGSAILFIRFNPDNYKVNSIKYNCKLETCMNKLCKYIEIVKHTYQESGLPDPIHICYMYYNEYNGNPIGKNWIIPKLI